MKKVFIPTRGKIPLIIILLITTTFALYQLFSSYKSISSINLIKQSLSDSACVIYARKLAHNLTTTNGYGTSVHLNSIAPNMYKASDYWNEDERFRPFNMTGIGSCSIIYCGVNVAGTDGIRFAKTYPGCRVWFLEPVSTFYQQFIHSSDWNLLMAGKSSHLYEAHSYGLSNQSMMIHVTDDSINEGQGLSLIDRQMNINMYQGYKLVVRDVAEVLFELKILKQSNSQSNPIGGQLTVLHINCEGCEYDVLEWLVHTSLIKYIRYVQFGSHRPLSIQLTIAERYCSLQEKLNKTHRMEYGIPWAWERWVLH
jgi:hypothetical protein